MRSSTFALFSTGLVAACSAPGPTIPPVGATVNVTGAGLSPTTVTLKVGEAVRFVSSSGEHSFVSGKDCEPDGDWNIPTFTSSFTMVYEEKKSYDFFCTIHCSGGESGTITVE